MAVIFIDRKKHSYYIKFGAHPAFEIAVERCLTELLQGRDFTDMYWVDKFSYFNKDANSFKNYKNQLTVAIGAYDSSLFREDFSYPFKGFSSLKMHGNKQHVKQLTGHGNYR